MNYDFTARMESGLDQVANDQAEWKAVLDGFFAEFSEQLEKAEKILKKEECARIRW